MCFYEKETNPPAIMHFQDVQKGLEFSTLLDHISLSSLQKLEISIYEDAFQSFCLGNCIYTHNFDSHLCSLKLSLVWSPYPTCTFLLDLFT